MSQVTLLAYVDRLAKQVSALDELKHDADDLLASGQISEKKHAELVDVLNDVAIGVDDLHARLRQQIKSPRTRK